MKYLYSWLKEYHPTIPPLDQITDVLIQLGHEVESIERQTLDGVIVVEIESIEKHPQADSLTLVTVSDGKKSYRIVCGAPDLKNGQKVALATVDTILPTGMTIRSATIRGETSEGMLCAADELGLGRDHSHLYPLPEEAELGQPITPFLPQDAIITAAITSNRGDVLSHFGLARDIAALTEKKLITFDFQKPQWSDESSQKLRIGTVIEDVSALRFAYAKSEKLVTTPLWMLARLSPLGYKSNSFAADLTNYLLLAFGQPLHAYDYQSLGENPLLGVRRGKEGEQLPILTHQTIQLTPQDLVITNDDQPIALAGTVGGENSKVREKSTAFIFETALFHPRTIHIMTRAHSIQSESAQRFERGIDPLLHRSVLEHCLALWQEVSGGEVYQPVTIDRSPEEKLSSASFTTEELNRFIGIHLTEEEIGSLLQALGCTVTKIEKHFSVTPPSWRFDLNLKEDYFEEILRSLPMDAIEKQPLPASVPQWKRSAYWREEWLKDTLAQLGGYEILTYPFISERQRKLHGYTEPLPELKIPPQSGKPFLRPSLVPSTLETVATNPETPFLIVFEIGTVFFPSGEERHVIIATAGSHGHEIDNFWRHLFERLSLPVSSWMARVQSVTTEIKEAYKIRKPIVSYLEIPVESITTVKMGDIPSVTIPVLESITYIPLGKYQSSSRDIALIVPSTVSSHTIDAAIRDFNPLIIDAELFDTYTDPKIGDNSISYAFHVVYQSTEKTLTSDEINRIHQELELSLKEHFHATIR